MLTCRNTRIYLLLLVVSTSNYCLAFTVSSRQPLRSNKGWPCNVKPSKLQGEFDLEAIEAFEKQLEEEEQKLKGVKEDVTVEDSLPAPSTDAQILEIPANLHNKRLDAAIAALMDPPLSRSACGSLIAEGHVKLVGTTEVLDRKSFKVETGMRLEVTLPKEETPKEIVPQDLPLEVLFEDEHMIVLNKAAHMVVHPAAGNWDRTVVNALAYYLPRSKHGRGEFVDENGNPIAAVEEEDKDSIGSDGDGEEKLASFRPGIVHRLDKGTTGVLVVAKTSQALTALSTAFANRRVSKTYLAVTVGNPGSNVKIDKPIGRHPIHRQRMRVVPDPQKNSRHRFTAQQTFKQSGAQAGRRALSYVDALAFDGKLGLVRVKIETGRTHQIRVHLQDRHTPIYGDDVYGLADWNKRLAKTHQIQRPLLHAYKLALHHPITGEPMEFTAPLDDDMRKIANTIVPPGSEVELSSLLNWG